MFTALHVRRISTNCHGRFKRAGPVAQQPVVAQQLPWSLGHTQHVHLVHAVAKSSIDLVSDEQKSYGSSGRWMLAVLVCAYCHHSISMFVLPCLVPSLGVELQLTDSESAALLSGYNFLYALALIPVGILADRVDRIKLLGIGVLLWSLLTFATAQADSFKGLLLVRTGFAVAQAVQNPVCFSIIPEMFKKNKSTAMAVYNAALYIGRAASSTAVVIASQVMEPAVRESVQTGVPRLIVPLELVDLTRVTVLYTIDDMVAIAPLYFGDTFILVNSETGVPWRQILEVVAAPGILIAAVVLFTTRDPRSLPPVRDVGSGDEAELHAAGDGIAPRGSGAFDSVSGAAGAASAARLVASAPSWDLAACLMMWDVAAAHAQQAIWLEEAAMVPCGARTPPQNDTRFGGAAAVGDEQTAASSPGGGERTILQARPKIVPSTGSCSPAEASRHMHGAISGAGEMATDVGRRGEDLRGARTVQSSQAEAWQWGSDLESVDARPPRGKMKTLLSTPSFYALTISATLNDIGSWAMVAWHPTFYEREMHMLSEDYALSMAAVLLCGGIFGGVGGGFAADWLSGNGKRFLLTSGACVAGAPFIAWSLLTENANYSFIALMLGYAACEAWRAPTAIMLKETSPEGLGSSATAVHLCIRNLIGGVGPLAVAALASKVGLRHALLLAPACFVVSGLGFGVTEWMLLHSSQGKMVETS